MIATQLLASLLLEALDFFGAGASFSIPKAVGVALIVVGGVLVVRY